MLINDVPILINNGRIRPDCYVGCDWRRKPVKRNWYYNAWKQLVVLEKMLITELGLETSTSRLISRAALLRCRVTKSLWKKFLVFMASYFAHQWASNGQCLWESRRRRCPNRWKDRPRGAGRRRRQTGSENGGPQNSISAGKLANRQWKGNGEEEEEEIPQVGYDPKFCNKINFNLKKFWPYFVWRFWSKEKQYVLLPKNVAIGGFYVIGVI